MSFLPNAKLGANNVEGFLNENGVIKFYRIRGADFSRFADRQAKSHEKRAKIDKYTRVERSPDGLALTLSHPKWPKSWTVASDDAGQLRYWQRAFVAAGATSSDSSKSSGSSKGARNKRSNRSRAPNKEQRGGVPVVAGDAPTLPEMFVELPPTPPPDPVSSAVSAAEATRDDVPPPLPPDDDSDGSDGNVSRKNAPPPVDAAPPAPPEPISAAAPRAPAPLKVVPPSTQVPLSPAVPKSSGSGVKAAPAPTGAASPISPRVQRDSAATVKSLIERSKLPPGGIIMPKPLGPDLKSPRVSQSAKEPPSSPRGSAIAAAKAPVVAETPKSPRGSAVSKPAEPTPAKVAVVEPAAVESSPAAVAPASSVAAIGARPSREAPKRQVSTAVATNTIVAPASAVATPATAPVAAPVTTATPVVVDKPIDKPVDKSAEIVVSPLVSDDPTITSVTLDSKMLVQMSSDEHATYFKTSGNTDDMPNVRAPTRVRGDDAAFSVTKAKTIPVAVTVLGQSRPDQELCLSFVANGVKLKINKDWVLNGQEVRNESVDGGGKATLVTLFVAIKYFEPPVTRVFVTARVKNTTTQKRLVLDVVQKVRDAAAVKPIVVPLAAPATAAAAVSAASAAAAVAPLSPATVKRSPSVAASMGSVTLAMNALELALDNETHVFYLSLAAKANALPGWNVRTLKVAPAAKEPVFAVKIGTPFPVRVMVGDSTTQLSVALTMGDKKLKNGRDWRLHSQTRTGEGADTELLLDIIVANASCDVPVLISAGASGAKLDRSTLLFQLLPANSEAPLSPRSRTAAPPPAAATATAAAAAAAVPAASPPVTQRARNATAAVAVESPPVGRARTATASSVGPLPPGWAEARTADGRTYYFNRSLNKTTWVRPTASSGPTSTGAAPAVAAAAAQSGGSGAGDDNDSSSDDDAAPLPPDWRAATNSAGRLYYFNVKTKQTSWTRPAPAQTEYASSSVLADDDPKPPTTGATHHYAPSSVLFESNNGVSKPVVPRAPPTAVAPTEPDDDDDDDVMPALSAGPQLLSDDDDDGDGGDEDLSDEDLKGPSFMTLDWTEKVSELSESFDGSRSDDGDDAVNDGTKFSVMPAAINNRFDTWVGGAEKSSDDEASDDGVVHEPAKVVSGTSGATMNAAAIQAASSPAPAAVPAAAAAAAPSTVVEDTGAPEGKQIKAGWKMALSSSSKRYWYNRATGETSWVFPAEGESVVSNLPPGWKQATSSSGQSYYYNTTTKETRWTRPIAVHGAAPAAQPAPAKSAPAAAAPVEDDLPSGWKQAVSKKNNRVYYFAPATGETSWTKPTMPVNAQLPKGWRQAKSAKGDVYYFNSKGVTRWTAPTEADAEQ